MIWWFEPWKDFIGSASKNDQNLGNIRPATLKPQVAPTLSPTAAPKYQFNRCDPQNDTGNCCNGIEGLCDLRADQILYATLHNAMSTVDDGFFIGANHVAPLEEALEAGYRGLNLDICNCGGELVFCHGICSFAPRDIVEVMQGVNKFLDDNPTESIVFIYQVNNDVDREVNLNSFYDQLELVDGLTEKLYVHSNAGTRWPTLRQQRASNKRIIMFHYNGPDCTVNPELCPAALMNYFGYGSDNNWEYFDVESIENRANSCTLKKNGINSKTFIGLNNFVSPPSKATAQILNDYTAVLDYVDSCTVLLQAEINFLLVDYWGEGDVPRYTQDHNAALMRRLN